MSFTVLDGYKVYIRANASVRPLQTLDFHVRASIKVVFCVKTKRYFLYEILETARE